MMWTVFTFGQKVHRNGLDSNPEERDSVKCIRLKRIFQEMIRTVLRGGRAIPGSVPRQARWERVLREHACRQRLQPGGKAGEHRTLCTGGARGSVVA